MPTKNQNIQYKKEYIIEGVSPLCFRNLKKSQIAEKYESLDLDNRQVLHLSRRSHGRDGTEQLYGTVFGPTKKQDPKFVRVQHTSKVLLSENKFLLCHVLNDRNTFSHSEETFFNIQKQQRHTCSRMPMESSGIKSQYNANIYMFLSISTYNKSGLFAKVP